VIISSKSAAGYSDFINQLNGNSFGYVFYTALIETPMQGTETELGVINALDKVAVNSTLFDLVVIIRGGGSQTDLSWFDSYNIAYHVTQFPLPVITGIGHEKDMSVTDMVANKALKTPTAVADFIIDAMSSAENQLLEMSSEIRDLGKEYTSKAGLVAANHSSRLVSSARSFSFNKVKAAERSIQSLIAFTLNSLNRNNTRLLGLENTLNILKPENVLQRGYTITSLNGRILKKSMQLKKDDVIDTLFRDGSVSSRVVDRHGSDKKE
jgi:exodeoxyribonuclease VII large subunit